MIGLIPAAGLATRLGGLPKFSLPLPPTLASYPGQTLLDFHLDFHTKYCDLTIVVTRPENSFLFKKYFAVPNVGVFVSETDTMAETVLTTHEIIGGTEYLLTMPDTYFSKNLRPDFCMEPRAENSEVRLATWRVGKGQKGEVGQVEVNRHHLVTNHADKEPGCQFPLLWGAMTFGSEYLKYVNRTDAHIGIGLSRALGEGAVIESRLQPGRYIDCGTPDGFVAMFDLKPDA